MSQQHQLTLGSIFTYIINFFTQHRPLIGRMIFIICGLNFIMMTLFFAFSVQTIHHVTAVFYDIPSAFVKMTIFNIIQCAVLIYLNACFIKILFNFEGKQTLRHFMKLDKQKILFLGRYIFIAVIIPLVFIAAPCTLIIIFIHPPFNSASLPILLILSITYFLFHMRLMLSLPAAFTDTPLSLKQSFMITKDHTLLLFAIFLIISITAFFFMTLCDQTFFHIETLFFGKAFLSLGDISYFDLGKTFSITFPHFLVITLNYLIISAIEVIKYCALNLAIAYSFCHITQYKIPNNQNIDIS